MVMCPRWHTELANRAKTEMSLKYITYFKTYILQRLFVFKFERLSKCLIIFIAKYNQL